MRVQLILCIAVLASLFFANPVRADVGAIADDGRRVILHDDGTWSEVSSPGGGGFGGSSQPTIISADEVGLVDVDVYEYTYRNWNNANWGTHPAIVLGSRVGGIPDTGRRIYVGFNHWPLAQAAASGARILLRFTTTDAASGQPDINVYRVASSWSEGTGVYHSGEREPNAAPGEISWSNQPSIDRSRVWSTTSLAPGRDHVDFDVTELVNSWLSGQFTNHGLVLIGQNEGTASYHWIFPSSETGDMATRPMLVTGDAVDPGQTGGTDPEPKNLIVNGSFEDARTGNGQSSNIPGWTVTTATVDIVGSYWQQIDGKHSVDLAGTPGAGGIAQDIRTEPGAGYALSFRYAGNPACDSPKKWMRIYFDGDRTWAGFEFSTQNTSLSQMGWKSLVYNFVAARPTTRIRFQSMGENQYCGFVIDDIRVTRR